MRCGHCPLDLSDECRGEKIKHFCRLVDPDDPIYTPGFIRILERDDHEGPYALPEETQSTESGTIVPCCGGVPLP